MLAQIYITNISGFKSHLTHFQSKQTNKKKTSTPKKFPEMQHSSSNITKKIIFSQKKASVIFSQKKDFLLFQEIKSCTFQTKTLK